MPDFALLVYWIKKRWMAKGGEGPSTDVKGKIFKFQVEQFFDFSQFSIIVLHAATLLLLLLF